MRDWTRAKHHIDPSRLSAYYDDALGPGERRLAEEHLAGCLVCQERLAGYAWLSGALRADEDENATTPATLDSRVAALLRAGPKREPNQPAPRLWQLRPALVAVLLVGLLVGAYLFGLPFDDAAGPAVAVAYPCDDPAECAIAVRFTGPVDRESVERSLQIDPPVPVRVAWQGDTLLVKPTEALQPSTSYTLSLRPRPAPGVATPVALHFVAGAPESPVAMATARGSATPTATPVATPTPAPPSPSPAVAADPPATATATPCGIQPVRGFGLLYRSRPKVASRLGCAREAERRVQIAQQPFEGGLLLWLADRRMVHALLYDNTWRSYPDTFDGAETATPTPGEPVRGFGKVWREQPDLRAALGRAHQTEYSVDGTVEEFEGGLLIWTPYRIIWALYADATWEVYSDEYRDDMPDGPPTPAPTPTQQPEAWSPTPVGPGPQPTIPPSAPTVAAQPSGLRCSAWPVRGFGHVYRRYTDLPDRLRCQKAPETAVQLARQTFEHGLMLWRADTREILVVREGDAWSAYQDTWREGEPLAEVGEVPDGLLAPERGFGKLWRQERGLREALGWATTVEQALPGAVQEFEGGRMLWTGDRVIYVLYPDGTWQSYADSYVEPTVTPSASPTGRESGG